MAGLADAKGHLTKTYQYSVTGEPTYGSATYENEYAYNGESYSPNIHSQYLRARYYSVVTASFLTEDSYLGSINEPLTLNRYNYCISSYPNYEDPSGNLPWRDLLQDSLRTAPPLSFYGRYGWTEAKARDMAEANLMALLKLPEQMRRTASAAGDFFRGIGASAYRNAAQAMAQEAALLGSALDFIKGYPVSYRKSMEQIQKKVALYEEGKAREAESMTAFYAGKCTGDVLSAAFVLISAAQAPDAGGQGWNGSTVSKGQLMTVDGRVVEVELAGERALVGVLGLAPSYSPSGVGDDFRNVWASVKDSKGLQGRSGSGGKLPEGGEKGQKSGNGSSNESRIKPGDKTLRGREYTLHGAERANERGFDSQKIDNIIDNFYKSRVKEVNEITGEITWRYQDNRGNTVITNEWGNKIITVYSHPYRLNFGNYIYKK